MERVRGLGERVERIWNCRVSALGGGGQGGVGDAYMHWRLRHTSVQILKEENTDVILKYIVKIRPFYFNPLFTMLTTLKAAKMK